MVPREADPRHTTGREKGARPGMNTEDRKSRLDTEGTAVLYWVCLMIGVLMWMIGELTTTSHLRAITREVEVLKTLVEQVRRESQCIEPVGGVAGADRHSAPTI